MNGLRPVEHGHVYFGQTDLTNASPKKIVEQGVGYIPEDRMSVGLATGLPLTENILLKSQGDPQFNQGWFLNETAVKATTNTLVQNFDIRTPSISIPVGRLSGGNIQKNYFSPRDFAQSSTSDRQPANARAGCRRN